MYGSVCPKPVSEYATSRQASTSWTCLHCCGEVASSQPIWNHFLICSDLMVSDERPAL